MSIRARLRAELTGELGPLAASARGRRWEESTRFLVRAQTKGLVIEECPGFRGKAGRKSAQSRECALHWAASLALPLNLQQKLEICLLDSLRFPGDAPMAERAALPHHWGVRGGRACPRAGGITDPITPGGWGSAPTPRKGGASSPLGDKQTNSPEKARTSPRSPSTGGTELGDG